MAQPKSNNLSSLSIRLTEASTPVIPPTKSRDVRFYDLALKYFPLLVVLFFNGCASTMQQRVSLTGDILVDGPKMIASGPRRDRVLWQYRTASAAMRRGQFDVAKPLLDDALLTLGGVYGKDAEARKARGLFNKEARKTFIGEPYERSMAYFYRGVIYWRDGELDNARACFRSAEFEDSDAEKSEYKGDWVLPDYLDGLATTKLAGDGSDAFKRAKAVAKNINLPDYNPQANVLFILEYGPGPEKYAGGKYDEELRFRARGSPVLSAQIKAGSVSLPVAPCDDLNFQATTRGGRVMDHVLANKAVFKGATDTIGDAAIISGAILANGRHYQRNGSADEIGAGLILMGVASKLISAATTPEADIRAWDNLPQFISLAALKMPPGEHVVTLEFNNASGAANPKLTKTITVNVPADHDKVVFVSDSSTTPQTQ
jgi:hypothetical protein